MNKLSNIRRVGRYQNTITCKKVNIHKGRKVGSYSEVFFYYKQGKHVYVSAYDLQRYYRIIGV